MKPSKVETVMREFKQGKLKSSSGQKVTNPKQAIAIGLSEAGMSKPKRMKEGGEMKKDSKAMAKKEIAFMQKKGAPKSMIKHEKAEYGMKSGGKAYRLGGMAAGSARLGPVTRGLKAGAGMGGLEKEETPQRTKSMNMKSGGKAYARGGGIETKGKTKGKMVKMMGGGKAC